jgi:hypothetical protein
MPAVPVTQALVDQLAAQRISPDHAAYVGIFNALGVWPGDVATNETYPIIGFHLMTDRDPANPNITCYMVGVGQFIRYEWTFASTMTFVCGIERVASVTERTEAGVLQVVIELDAQASVEQLQSEGRQNENGVLQTVAQSVRERAKYTLTATDEYERLTLSALSLGLRTALAG